MEHVGSGVYLGVSEIIGVLLCLLYKGILLFGDLHWESHNFVNPPLRA